MANYIKKIGRGCCCINNSETGSNESSQELVLITTYSVSSAEPTQLYFYNTSEILGAPIIRGIDRFDKIEIDGVEVGVADIDSNGGTYNLGAGLHSIEYTLKDSTKISMGMFVGCQNLVSATIPSGVTSIEEAAFNVCTSLISIIIPNGVTSIGNGAFNGCESLTSITIPDNVTSIGDGTFEGCYGLTSINIPSSITNIGNRTFYSCVSLTSINIPSGITSIGQNTFSFCSSLTNITIPSSVTNIGDYTFNSCSSLSAVTCLPTTPPTLGSNVFYQNASGRKIYVPSESETAYEQATNWSTYASDIEPIN